MFFLETSTTKRDMGAGLTPSGPRMSPEEQLRTRNHPAVPPALTDVVKIPVRPVPTKLETKKGTKVEATSHRAYVKELYLSAANVIFPDTPNKSHVGWFSKAVAKEVVTAACDKFIRTKTAPAAYVGWYLSRAHDAGRTVAPAPAYVFDPSEIDGNLPKFARSLPKTQFARAQIMYPEWVKQLEACARWVQNSVLALPRYDEAEILRVVRSVFPDGWEPEYAHAAELCTALQARMDEALVTGQYIWGYE